MEAVVWPAPTTRTYSSGPPEDIAAVYPDYKTNLNIIALLVIGLSASESDTSSTASGQ
jgi:hypothetical protein